MDPGLAAVAAWLRKRGKAVRPFLNKEQRQHLRECFELIDTDGSGDIDVGELHAVFEALGDHVSIRETVEMMREVDRDGSMSIEFPEFVEIMTQVRTDKDEEQPKLKDGCPKTQHIQLMASAYRRKKVMEGVIMDQGSWRTKFVRLHEARLEEARQAEQARKARLLKRQDTLAFALEAMASTGRRGSGTGSRTSSSASVLKLTPRLDDIPTADASTVGDLTARSTRSDQLKQESNAGSPRSTWSMLGSPRERHPPTPIGRQSDCSGAQTARTVTLVSPRPSPRPAADPAANGKGSLWGKLALQKAAPDEKLVGSGLNGGAESLKALKLRAAIRRKYESDAQEVAVSRIWLACRSASFSKKPKKCNPGSSGDAHRQTASGSTDCETPNGAAGSINIATTSQAGPCADELQVGQAHLMWGDDDSSLAHTLAVNGNTARTSVFHMLAGEAPQPGGRPPSLTVHFGATHRPRSPNGPLSPSRTLGPQLRDALSPTVEKRRLALSLPLKPHVAKVDQGGPSGSKSARYMRDAGPLGSATGHCAKHQARATVHEVPLLALPTSTVEELLTGGSKAVRAARRQALTERATAKPTAMRQRIKLEAQEQVRCSAA
ncbi:hypothetical protein WJX72_008388 [[Myrmecia] bisecta]|uniref:EF-hand domain-containing protein n=1 Tax=[Myrmecia] bisecta TaxID=41462 RepID=A0AAW1P780_9CHLO